MPLTQSPTTGKWYDLPDSGASPSAESPYGFQQFGNDAFVRSPSTGRTYQISPNEIDLFKPAPIAPQAPEPGTSAADDGVKLTDYVKLFMSGSAGVGQTLNKLTEISPVGMMAKSLGYDPFTTVDRLASDAVDYWHDALSPAMKQEMTKQFVQKNEFGEYEWGGAGITTALGTMTESLPSTIASVGVGAGITKVLQTFANPIGRTVLIERAAALRKSGIADAANQALKKLRLVDAAIGVGSFGAAEGLIAGGSDYLSVYKQVQELPPDQLMKNERYQQVLSSTDEAMSEIEKHAYAAEVVAREAASTAGWQSGLTTALLGAPMGAFFGGLLGKTHMGRLTATRTRAALSGAAGEAAQEVAQSGAEQRIINEQMIQAGDTNRDPNEDVFNQMVGGGLAGGVMGGALAGAEWSPQGEHLKGKPPANDPRGSFRDDQLNDLKPETGLPALSGPAPTPDFVADSEGNVGRPGQSTRDLLALPPPGDSGRIVVDSAGAARPEKDAEFRDVQSEMAARRDMGIGPERVKVPASWQRGEATPIGEAAPPPKFEEKDQEDVKLRAIRLKKFLKTNIDTGPAVDPKSLPGEPDKYFEPADAGTVDLPFDKLIIDETEHVNAEGTQKAGDVALKRFSAAASGRVPRRPAIDVKVMADGRFQVVDGNGTVVALKRLPAATAARARIVDFEVPEHDDPKEAAKLRSYVKHLTPEARVDLVTQQQEATAFKPEFDKGMAEVAKETGTEFRPTGLKSSHGWGRIAEKVVAENGGDAKGLKDFVRGTIVVETPEQAKAALDAIVAKFGQAPGTSIRANMLQPTPEALLAADESGYADIKVNIKGANGRAYEVQISTEAMLKAKEVGHKHYNLVRSIDAAVMKKLGVSEKDGKDAVKAAVDKGMTKMQRVQRATALQKSQDVYLPPFKAFWAASSRASKSGSGISVPSSSIEKAGTAFQPLPGKNLAAPRDSLLSMATSPSTSQKVVGVDLAPASVLPSIAVSPRAQSVPQPDPDAIGRTRVKAGGTDIAVEPQVVEASDLITSDKSEYPQELQPRQRGARAASSSQVSGMAANLDPELLGFSPEAHSGAPIVSPDNEVESGNGRVMAIRQAFAAHPEKAAAYRAYLEKLGFDTKGMKEPVLVRKRTSQMTPAERKQFTVDANTSTVMKMSAAEQAAADAAILDDGLIDMVQPGQDLSSAGNAPFVRAFLSKLSTAEVNDLVAADGTISQAGVRRIQGAILASAYGGSESGNAFLARSMESTDDNIRSITNALLDAAPEFARIRQGVRDGVIASRYALTEDLIPAVETVSAVREKGDSIDATLRQNDAFGDITPLREAIIRLFYNRQLTMAAGRDKINAELRYYAKQAQAQNVNQGAMFGDKPPSPLQIVQGALNMVQPEPRAAKQKSIFSAIAAPTQLEENRTTYDTQSTIPEGAGEVSAKRPVPDRDVQPASPVQLDIFENADLRPNKSGAFPKAKTHTSLTQTGSFQSSIKRVETWKDAANIVAPLRKSPQENMLALVLDASGKPLAVLRHSVGTASSASVEPWSIAGAILRVPKAAAVYFAHNHPSGNLTPSRPDVAITNRLANILLNTGVSTKGMLIVAPGEKRANFFRPYTDYELSPNAEDMTMAPRVGGDSVPQLERRITRTQAAAEKSPVPSQTEAVKAVEKTGERSGILMLSGDHSVLGVIPLNNKEMHKLRTDSADSGKGMVLSRFEAANAEAAIPFGSMEEIRNVNAMLLEAGIRVIDTVRMTGTGWTTTGPIVPPSVYYSRSGSDATSSQAHAAIVDSLKAAIAEVAPLVNVRVVQSISELEPEIGIVPSDVEGAYLMDGKTVVLVSDNLKTPERAQEVFLHEVFGHLAMERSPEMAKAIDMVRTLRGMKNKTVVDAWNHVARTQPNLDRIDHAKEVIAKMAEDGVKNSVIDRVIAAAREMLRKMGIKLQVGEKDLRALIARAARNFRADVNAVTPEALQGLSAASSDDEIVAALDKLPAGPNIDAAFYLENELAGLRKMFPADSQTSPPRWAEERMRHAEAALAQRDSFAPWLNAQGSLDGPRSRERARAIDYTDGLSGGNPPGYMKVERDIAFSRAAPAAPDLESAMDRIMSRAPESLTMRDKARELWQKIRNVEMLEVKQGMIDQFASIEALEQFKNEGKLEDASTSAYKAALATKNLSSVMAAVMMKGAPVYKDGVFQPAGDRKGLIEIFKPLTTHPDGNLLRQWEFFAAANRAKRLKTEKNRDGSSREKLFTDADIALGLALEEKYPEFRTVLNEWAGFNQQILDLAEESGILDAESRKIWQNNDYVPFYRAMEDAAEGPKTAGTLANQRANIKTLQGSEKQIGNIFENMVMNTAHLIDASFKNRAMQKIVELADGVAMEKVELPWQAVKFSNAALASALRKAGVLVGNIDEDGNVVERMTKEQREAWSTMFRKVAPKGPDIVSMQVAGKPEYYRVTDPLLLRSIGGMGTQRFDGLLTTMFRGSKKILTGSIAIDPAFMLANFVRDTLSTWVQSDASMHPVVDAVKGLKASWSEDPALMQMMMAGAGGGGYYDSAPADIRKLVAQKVPAGEVNAFMNSIVSPKKLWRVWHKIGSASENANRIAVFKAVLAGGGTLAEAAYQARDVLNFGMRGDYGAMKWITETVPFMNARIQGLYRLFRGARDNKKAFMMKGAMLMAATMALAAANDDRPEYEDLKEFDKDLYWHLFVGGEHFRIPKPFEVGALFATIPERAWRGLSGRDSGKLVWQRLFAMMADTFAFNPIPQAVKPIIEQYANKSMFTGAPIVGQAEQNLQPEAQFTPWTSATMRELAVAMPDWAPEWIRSPRRLEAAMRGYFGALGMYAVGVSDQVVREGMGYPEAPGRKIYDYPVVQRFLSDPNPRTTKYADMMYQMIDESNAIYSTMNRFRREQRFEDAARILDENKGKLAVRTRLNHLGNQVRRINEQIRITQYARVLSADAKRERIDALVERKNAITRQVAPLADLF